MACAVLEHNAKCHAKPSLLIIAASSAGAFFMFHVGLQVLMIARRVFAAFEYKNLQGRPFH
jgi:hypothetical protein